MEAHQVDKRIAICVNDKIFDHSGNWNKAWIKLCDEAGVPYDKVDCYRPDVIALLKEYDILLWAIQNYVISDMLESRSVLKAAQQLGLNVFPDQNTSWHFDDKIAQMYLLQSAGIRIPDSWGFYLEKECVRWLKNEAEYPLVAKLKSGSGSNNVKLLKTPSEAVTYTKKMFGKGFDPSPSLLYKAYSKAQSARGWATALKRIKRIPEFLHTLSHAKQFPKERGYCYFQALIPNDGYDLKVAVVGGKLGFFARRTRKGEWRASGGGDFYYDKTLVTRDVIDLAFQASKAIGCQCMGYDFIVDRHTQKPYIIEMCYGFDYQAVYDAGGYWDSDGAWHDQPLHVPEEVLNGLLKA